MWSSSAGSSVVPERGTFWVVLLWRASASPAAGSLDEVLWSIQGGGWWRLLLMETITIIVIDHSPWVAVRRRVSR